MSIPLDLRDWRKRFMSYPNRTLCDVLEEMRKCNETKNYSYLEGLIEEAQSMANRMEASLSDKHDYERARKAKKEEEKNLKELKKQIKKAEKKLEKLK
jgi:hypothetical protein